MKIQLVMVLFLVPVCLFGKDIALSDPSVKSGKDLIAAINDRVSSRTFVDKDISTADLSTILWAGNGLRRNVDASTGASKAGRTVAYSGDNIYVNVYVFGEYGTYFYDANKKILKQISEKDDRSSVTPEFMPNANYIILFTMNAAKFPAAFRQNMNTVTAMANATAGFSAQNIALTAMTLQISSIVMYNINAKNINSILKLGKDETPLFIMQLGYAK